MQTPTFRAGQVCEGMLSQRLGSRNLSEDIGCHGILVSADGMHW